MPRCQELCGVAIEYEDPSVPADPVARWNIDAEFPTNRIPQMTASLRMATAIDGPATEGVDVNIVSRERDRRPEFREYVIRLAAHRDDIAIKIATDVSQPGHIFI